MDGGVMEITGRTKTGKIVVEMSEEEANELSLLSQAVEGTGYPSFTQTFYERLYPDLANTFGVIRTWYQNKYNINGIRNALDEIERQLGEKNDAKK